MDIQILRNLKPRMYTSPRVVLGLRTGNAEGKQMHKYAVEWTNDARWLQANGMVDGEVDYLIRSKGIINDNN